MASTGLLEKSLHWNSTTSSTAHQSHRIHGAGIYANIGGILMVNVTIYSIHGSYGNGSSFRVSVDVAKSCDVDDEET
jgi:hypothetical protein